MSASNTAPPVPAIATAITMDMWDDVTTDLNENRHKKDVPALPARVPDGQVVFGAGIETVCYLVLQVIKTPDREVVMRAIASICIMLLDDKSNFLGARSKPVELTGLDVITHDNVDTSLILNTNFADAEPVTVGELIDMMSVDNDEIGSYVGWMFYASQKQLTDLNMAAFNQKRQSAATATLMVDPKIFVNDSPYLDRDMAKKMYASFLSCSPWRAHMVSRVVTHLGDPLMGPALAFATQFMLLVDNGMSALKIIKETVMRHPWVRTSFPELQPDLQAANQAQTIIKRAPSQDRSFLKAIHGNNFVPVSYSQIDNLTGVCKEILKRTIPSYQNYGGGKITEAQLAKINEHLGQSAQLAATVSAE